jgi:hypothetical protein
LVFKNYGCICLIMVRKECSCAHCPISDAAQKSHLL